MQSTDVLCQYGDEHFIFVKDKNFVTIYLTVKFNSTVRRFSLLNITGNTTQGVTGS